MAAAAAGAAGATMVERLPLERVTQEAARIVQATVSEIRSGRDQAGLPATWITLAVSRTIKGPHAARLTIKQYGVMSPLADGTITRVAGMPSYVVGEEVVLFLHGTSARGFTSPVGLGQGAYRVRRGAGGARVRSESAPSGSRDLEEFLSEITRFAGRAP